MSYIQSGKWIGRPFRKAINADEAEYAVTAVLEKLAELSSSPNPDDTQYFQRVSEGGEVVDAYEPDDDGYVPFAQVVGAWVVGSAASGRWLEESDIDVWLQVSGLTELGYKKLAERMHDDMKADAVEVFALNKARVIDIEVSKSAPDPNYSMVEVPLE